MHIEHAQQDCARRSHSLHRLARGVNRRIAQQRQRGRRRNGKGAVLANHGSAAHVERRRNPSIHAQCLGARRGADDIDDGVHRAHFVEMHFFNGNGMDGGFSLAQQLEGAHRALLYRSREGRGLNDFENRGQRTVRRVLSVRVRLMLMMPVLRMFRVRVFWLSGQGVGCNHVHFNCSQPATAHLAHLQPRTNVQRSGCLRQTGEGDARIHQGSQQHIAADARKAFKITNTHRKVILNCRLCAALGQHIDGQNCTVKNLVHCPGAKTRAIKRHILETRQLESGGDGVEHLNCKGAR